MKKIYLAGKMSGIPLQEQKGWRDYLKKQLEDTGNFKVLSPCDYYSYEKKEHKSEREIMNWELNYVKNSDIIGIGNSAQSWKANHRVWQT